MGAAWLLPRLIGLSRATEWLMLGDGVKADAAKEAGFAHQVVPKEEVMETAMALAKRLASGPTLAFGPGHVDGTAAPNARGNSVIAGHRDGSFRFLDRLRIDDVLHLETRGGRESYRVVRSEVRDREDHPTVEESVAQPVKKEIPRHARHRQRSAIPLNPDRPSGGRALVSRNRLRFEMDI